MTAIVAGRPCMLGCDVSRWQGGINYGVFNLDFVFYKASGGDAGLYVDPKFAANAAGFQTAEGPYHFAGQGDPRAEANFFCDTILASAWATMPRDHQLPPVLDAEWTGPWLPHMTKVAWALTFCNQVHARTGRVPWIYTGKYVFDSADPALAQYLLFLAAYVSNPDAYVPAPWLLWSTWQSGSTGSVSGIAGNCDTDAMLVSVYHDALTTTPTPAPAPQLIPAPAPQEQDDMIRLMRESDKPEVYAVSPLGRIHVTDLPTYAYIWSASIAAPPDGVTTEQTDGVTVWVCSPGALTVFPAAG